MHKILHRVSYPLRPGLCCQCESRFRNLQAPVKIPTASAQDWYTAFPSSPQCTDHFCRELMGSNTIHPGSQELDGRLSVVSEPCVGPQQLLDSHPGVPGPHRGCIYHRLHHQTGQQCQETCRETTHFTSIGKCYSVTEVEEHSLSFINYQKMFTCCNVPNQIIFLVPVSLRSPLPNEPSQLWMVIIWRHRFWIQAVCISCMD